MSTDIDDFDFPSTKSPNHEEFKSFVEFIKSMNKVHSGLLIHHGFIKAEDDHESYAKMFQNRSTKQFNLFRKRSDANEMLELVWQSKVSTLATERIINSTYKQFSDINKNDLKQIAQLSVDNSSIVDMPSILAKKGIALIYLRALPGLKIDGSVFIHQSGLPVIGISFRYARVDHFWFTLLHELSHICLHKDLLKDPILENFEDEDHQSNTIEVQANRLAKHSFADRVAWRNCNAKYSKNKNDVIEFASRMNIHPAIVAGFLRREQGNYARYGEIINETNTRELVFGND